MFTQGTSAVQNYTMHYAERQSSACLSLSRSTITEGTIKRYQEEVVFFGCCGCVSSGVALEHDKIMTKLSQSLEILSSPTSPSSTLIEVDLPKLNQSGGGEAWRGVALSSQGISPAQHSSWR